LYAYTAFNTLYTYDWNESLLSSYGQAIEAEGRERRKINSFIDFTLQNDDQQVEFLEGLRAIVPTSGRTLVEEMHGLLPFTDSDGNLKTLRTEVIMI